MPGVAKPLTGWPVRRTRQALRPDQDFRIAPAAGGGGGAINNDRLDLLLVAGDFVQGVFTDGEFPIEDPGQALEDFQAVFVFLDGLLEVGRLGQVVHHVDGGVEEVFVGGRGAFGEAGHVAADLVEGRCR